MLKQFLCKDTNNARTADSLTKRTASFSASGMINDLLSGQLKNHFQQHCFAHRFGKVFIHA